MAEVNRWQHSRAYILALAAFMGIFMFGYDTVSNFARSVLRADEQGLGGGLIALPSFAKDFGFNGLDPKALADRKGNIVSILQAGW